MEKQDCWEERNINLHDGVNRGELGTITLVIILVVFTGLGIFKAIPAGGDVPNNVADIIMCICAILGLHKVAAPLLDKRLGGR